MSRFDPVQSALQANLAGEIWECGCAKGDFAHEMLPLLLGRTLRLFDTFKGMPFSGPFDHHQVGSMNDSDYETVRQRFQHVPNVLIHQGTMPDTFAGLEDRVIAAANIDVDNYDSVKACLEFVYPRMVVGGTVFLDDYNCGDCPGAKRATHEFLADKPEELILLAESGAAQARFVKL